MSVRDNIDTWKKWTEPNYPLLFISKWIPFNAWYVNLIGKKDDRSCLNYFKLNPENEVYYRILELLFEKKPFDCVLFQHEFCELDKLLSENVIPIIGERIIFGEVELTANPKSDDSMTKDGFKYRVVRYIDGNAEGIPPKTIKVFIQNLRDRHTDSIQIQKHEITLLEEELRKKSIKGKKKKIILELFKNIEPTVHVDIKDAKKKKLKICGNRYCDNKIAIAASIVDVLYELRCKAVHGELSVQPMIPEIYQHAFTMLDLITKKLF